MNREVQRILVVDDEEDLCDILRFNLENEGYAVDVAYSAEEALRTDLNQYDLLLLDVMMGEISGFRMIKMLRAKPETADLPVIFLTARDTENDTVTGLSLGADDYISKPFSIREVVLRVKAVLRRNKRSQSPRSAFVSYLGIQLDMSRKTAVLDGTTVSLTKTEFEILALLIQGAGRVYSRAEIVDLVWQDDAYVLDRTVDVNITRLRRKLGAYGQRIITRQGYGYCFQME
mgnify:FL=1